jgi:hypothetical protein
MERVVPNFHRCVALLTQHSSVPIAGSGSEAYFKLLG